MPANSYKSFALVGVGKTVGIPVVKSFLARGVSVLVLTRPSSTTPLPEGTKVVRVDYADVNTVSGILKEHSVDVLVSTLSGDGFSAQVPLADAAKAAGVKLYVPSEFGVPTEGAKEGMLALKDQSAAYLRSISLPSLRLYASTGPFQEFIPTLTAVEATGKFLIVGKGQAPISFTAISDVAEYLAEVLTMLPPEELQDKIHRIEGQRASLSEIGQLFEGRAPVEYVEAIPSSVPHGQLWEYLQRHFDTGAGSTGWDIVADKEGSEPAGGANKLYPGFRFKTVKETLGL